MSKKKLDFPTKSKIPTNRNSITFQADQQFQNLSSPSSKYRTESTLSKSSSRKINGKSSNQINLPTSDYYQPSQQTMEAPSILKRPSIGKSSYLLSHLVNSINYPKSTQTSQIASVMTIPPHTFESSTAKIKSSATTMSSLQRNSNAPTGLSTTTVSSNRNSTRSILKSLNAISPMQSGSTIPSVFRSPHRHIKHSPTRASSLESPSSISSCKIEEQSDIFVPALSSSSTKASSRHPKKLRSSSTIGKRTIDLDTLSDSLEELAVPTENVVEWFLNLPTKHQYFESPVDIDINAMERLQLPPLSWKYFDANPRKLKLTNTGHTLILSGKWFDERPTITGGPLTSDYTFSQLHFHWGCDANEGSEHTVDGQQYPLEMHVVTYKSEYGSQECALKEDDGMCTLAYFFTLQKNSNPNLQKLINNIHEVKRSQSAVHIDPFPIGNFVKSFPSDYFLYWGSVSTSDCKHLLLWIICREPIGISPDQIYSFRTMLDQYNEPLVRNYRPVDPRQKPRIFHVNPSRFSTLHYKNESSMSNKSPYRIHQCTTGSHEHMEQ